jgi:hypothetical protein
VVDECSRRRRRRDALRASVRAELGRHDDDADKRLGIANEPDARVRHGLVLFDSGGLGDARLRIDVFADSRDGIRLELFDDAFERIRLELLDDAGRNDRLDGTNWLNDGRRPAHDGERLRKQRLEELREPEVHEPEALRVLGEKEREDGRNLGHVGNDRHHGHDRNRNDRHLRNPAPHDAGDEHDALDEHHAVDERSSSHVDASGALTRAHGHRRDPRARGGLFF